MKTDYHSCDPNFCCGGAESSLLLMIHGLTVTTRRQTTAISGAESQRTRNAEDERTVVNDHPQGVGCCRGRGVEDERLLVMLTVPHVGGTDVLDTRLVACCE